MAEVLAHFSHLQDGLHCLEQKYMGTVYVQNLTRDSVSSLFSTAVPVTSA